MESAMDLGPQLIRVVGSLALVIGLLVVGLYGLKYLGRWTRKPQSSTWIQMVAQHSVGLKHHLLLVKVQEQMFLLGVSPQGMHLLAPLHGSSASPPFPEEERK